MLKKAWDGIKQIVTLKTKDKTTPNLFGKWKRYHK